jgi:nicotinamide-nucleotide amidase
MRVELINTGSELLLGFTVNSHLNHIARKLADIGLRLDRQTTVGDSLPEMKAVVAEALQRCDVLIVTGGLGPTSDDVTRDVVAGLLGRTLVRDEAVAAAIAQRFRKRGLVMPESVYVQALVPADARVLPNPNGTAPGLAIEEGNKLVVLLPGPPRELKPMLEEHVLPLLRQRIGDAAPFVCRVFKVAGLPESTVEAKIAPALADLPGVELGYCAKMGEVEVRIITATNALADEIEKRARLVLGDTLFGVDDDRLEEVVVHLLAREHKTIAVAESCTGGLIAHRITNVSGASAVFISGLVTYADEAKMQLLGVAQKTLKTHGAVSEETCREMAEGARTRGHVDFALSTTGIAGPTGGAPDKPVGLVYIGLATPAETVVQRHVLSLDRETFKFFVSQIALDMLRRELLKTKS